jgi:hypothetical protein
MLCCNTSTGVAFGACDPVATGLRRLARLTAQKRRRAHSQYYSAFGAAGGNASTASSEGSESRSVLKGSSPITFTSPSSKAHQKSGSFPPPALPSFDGRMTLSDSRQSRRLTATLRPLLSLATYLSGQDRFPRSPSIRRSPSPAPTAARALRAATPPPHRQAA